MTATDIEREALEEGKRLHALAREGALKARQSNLVKELEKIEEELKAYVSPAPEPAPVKRIPKAKSSEASADAKSK